MKMVPLCMMYVHAVHASRALMRGDLKLVIMHLSGLELDGHLRRPHLTLRMPADRW